jgi:large subunit ribosomal protein L29
MASKKYLELQDFSETDLQAELEETETRYLKMQFDHAITGLDNPMQLREVRRDIARLKSELRRRELLNAPKEVLENRTKIRARRRSKA